jgi:nitrogen fixation-related uncharacterized protein
VLLAQYEYVILLSIGIVIGMIGIDVEFWHTSPRVYDDKVGRGRHTMITVTSKTKLSGADTLAMKSMDILMP